MPKGCPPVTAAIISKIGPEVSCLICESQRALILGLSLKRAVAKSDEIPHIIQAIIANPVHSRSLFKIFPPVSIKRGWVKPSLKLDFKIYQTSSLMSQQCCNYSDNSKNNSWEITNEHCPIAVPLV